MFHPKFEELEWSLVKGLYHDCFGEKTHLHLMLQNKNIIHLKLKTRIKTFLAQGLKHYSRPNSVLRKQRHGSFYINKHRSCYSKHNL
jgi:hypothetical protein